MWMINLLEWADAEMIQNVYKMVIDKRNEEDHREEIEE